MKPFELIAQLVVDEGLGVRPGLGSLPLAKRIGQPGLQSAIYKFLNGKVEEPARSTVEPIASYFKIPTEAFYDEGAALDVARARGMFGLTSIDRSASDQVAQSVSQSLLKNAQQDGPQRVAWGSMKHEALPELFEVVVPDNAMADRVKKGYRVIFDKHRKPRPDEGVLVANAAGEWFFRAFIPGAGGRFKAVPLNKDYLPGLDSEADGLTILGTRVSHTSDEEWG